MSTRQPWTDERVERELRHIVGELGRFPSNSELRTLGRNDLACAVCKRGGLLHWANRIGARRAPSDSDFGWAGESVVAQQLRINGFTVEQDFPRKNPFDLLVDGVVRIDVKTARFATYRTKDHTSEGWFFRIGKMPQADVIALHLFDDGDTFVIPWRDCPYTNVTITGRGACKYERFRNRWDVIRNLASALRAIPA